jgi:hypothetical protein
VSSDPDFDPFADPPGLVEAKLAEVAEAVRRHNEERNEVAGSNEISVTFKAHGGFDAPWVVVRGTPEYLADLLGVKEFDGRVSTLMKQVAKVDEFYKKQISGDSGKG